MKCVNKLEQHDLLLQHYDYFHTANGKNKIGHKCSGFLAWTCTESPSPPYSPRIPHIHGQPNNIMEIDEYNPIGSPQSHFGGLAGTVSSDSVLCFFDWLIDWLMNLILFSHVPLIDWLIDWLIGMFIFFWRFSFLVELAAPPIPFDEASLWCSVQYFELNQRVGELFQVHSEPGRMGPAGVTIDGFTDPTDKGRRFSLGQLSNIQRNTQTESTRKHIGKGEAFSSSV